MMITWGKGNLPGQSQLTSAALKGLQSPMVVKSLWELEMGEVEDLVFVEIMMVPNRI